jgi:hypothetical protein
VTAKILSSTDQNNADVLDIKTMYENNYRPYPMNQYVQDDWFLWRLKILKFPLHQMVIND